MNIIGITGPIGHGKSSLAQALQAVEPNSIYLESYLLIAEVIDAWHKRLKKVPKAGDYDELNRWLSELPAILKRVVHAAAKPEDFVISPAAIAKAPLEYQKLFQHLDALKNSPELAVHKINDGKKASYRPILQWVGGYVTTHVDGAVWFKELVRRVRAAGNQGTTLAIIGGVRFPADAKVISDSGGKIIEITRPDHPESDIQDPTERQRKQIKRDAMIINSGTLDDLRNCAKILVKDFAKDRLNKEYKCKANLTR